jgi:hypothetical protein
VRQGRIEELLKEMAHVRDKANNLLQQRDARLREADGKVDDALREKKVALTEAVKQRLRRLSSTATII